jgi:anti-sigma factor RsiW
MDCEQVEELLSALADGELTGAAAWRLRRHVRTCARCTAELAALEETRAAVRRRSPSPAPHLFSARSRGAPPDFWPSVSHRLDGIDAARALERRTRPPRLHWMAVSALLALLLAVAVFLALRPAPVLPAWAAAQHAQPLRSEPGRPAFLTTSPNDASVWLSRQLGRRVPPLDLELVGLELQGALAWNERGAPTGLLRYARGRERWSLLVIPAGGELAGSRRITAGRQPFETSAADRSMLAAWHSQGSLFVLAGPRPEGELLRVARRAARACETER